MGMGTSRRKEAHPTCPPTSPQARKTGATGCKGDLTRKELEFSSYQDSSLARTAQQHPLLDIKSSLESSTRLSLATVLPEGTTVSKVTLRYTLFLLDDEVPTLFVRSSKRQSVKALHHQSKSQQHGIRWVKNPCTARDGWKNKPHAGTGYM
jgi:hypothetical protein